MESEGSLTDDQKQFGPELRALPFVVSRKNVVSVPGFYKSKMASTSKSDESKHDDKAKPAATTHTSTPVVSEMMAADGIEKSGQGTNEQLWEEAVTPKSPKITHATRNLRDFVVNESPSLIFRPIIIPVIKGRCSQLIPLMLALNILIRN